LAAQLQSCALILPTASGPQAYGCAAQSSVPPSECIESFGVTLDLSSAPPRLIVGLQRLRHALEGSVLLRQDESFGLALDFSTLGLGVQRRLSAYRKEDTYEVGPCLLIAQCVPAESFVDG
jgi:hypothetical protein